MNGQDHRKHKRHRLQPNFGYLNCDQGGGCVCMLRDISCSGASAEMMQVPNSKLPPVGTKIHFENFPEGLNDLIAERNATVVWCCGNRVGMQFNQLIPLEDGSRPTK